VAYAGHIQVASGTAERKHLAQLLRGEIIALEGKQLTIIERQLQIGPARQPAPMVLQQQSNLASVRAPNPLSAAKQRIIGVQSNSWRCSLTTVPATSVARGRVQPLRI